MKWNEKDIETFMKEKEYMDTAVIPLLPVSLGEKARRSAEQGDFTNRLALHLERQFKGRLLLLPPYAYVSGTDVDKLASDLAQWKQNLSENGISFPFYVTSDPVWKDVPLEGSLFYMPSVPLQDMNEDMRHTVMDEQVKKLMPSILQAWQGEASTN